MGINLGIKNAKGTVSIENYRSRIRMRWRFNGIRHTLNLSAYTKINLQKARRLAVEIERDMALDNFDTTLLRYKGEPATTAIITPFKEQYEEWVSNYLNMDCEKNVNYNAFRNMIRKWGLVNETNVLEKLNAETFCIGTYNRRLTISQYYSFLILYPSELLL